MAENSKKSSNTVTWIIGSLTAIGVSIAGYLAYDYFSMASPRSSAPQLPQNAKSGRSQGSSGGTSVKDKFPLKRGSSGPNVKALQQALMIRFGSSVLPSGDDSDFGGETQAALSKNGMSTTVTREAFNKLAAYNGPPVFTLDGVNYLGRYARAKSDFMLVSTIGVHQQFRREEIVGIVSATDPDGLVVETQTGLKFIVETEKVELI